MEKFNCLMYHEINDHGDKYALQKDTFLEQLQYLVKYNLKAQSIRNIHNTRDEGAIAFSFDDGFTSDIWAGEQLAKFGFTATFFVVEDFIRCESNKYMNQAQLKELAAMGHEIGIHGKNHHAWTNKQKGVLLMELTETQNWLKEITGAEIDSCSAPGGKINNEIVTELQESGLFSYVRNSIPWYTSFDSFVVNGTAILKDESYSTFEKKISGDTKYYKYLYAKNGIKKIVKPLIGK